ncbi:MAG: hydantoinase/oxoprolinase family protein [Deltaproteobacteria bacterium]|nr:hydantoinase/oxoprolinase family protein [Deltaproteobacteria bacterium]
MRVAFDIGGTFTDVIVIDNDGRIITTKVLSLLDRVGEDIVACIRPLAHEHQVECFVHGTTIASNAIIEGTTAPTVLITTHGFRDTLEMRGERRPNVQDPNWIRSPALVPRRLRLEVNERILGDGSIEQALDPGDVRALLRTITDEPIEAIAVALINAYVNPIHEQQLRGLIVSELGPDLAICLSSEIYPQIREYERTSTTVINASLVPVIDRYLNQVEKHLAAYSGRLLIMQSNGGIMSSQAARRKPAYMIESGPAAGVLAAARLAREAGLEKVLSFDMGGTTAKACLVESGVPAEKPAGEIGAGVNTTTHLFYKGGHALIVPSLDIVEVGAGGGSIAWVEEGTLRVGPRSAGAEPGPVCYSRGGHEPTVTDTNVVLGYMNPEAIAGSALRIDYRAAFDAIKRQIADPLQLEVMDAAFGITQIANSLMMRALRAVSTERGRDPRDFTLVAFGGAGPIHAAALAETMDISTLLVPVFPGLFSALGLLLADYRHDYIHSIVTSVDMVEYGRILARFSELEQAAVAEMRSEGVLPEAIAFERYADLKYCYQLQELTLAFPQTDEQTDIGGLLKQLFTQEHERAFGYRSDDPIELVSLRVRASANAGRLRFAELSNAATTVSGVRSESDHSRQVYFGGSRGLLHTPIYGRKEISGIQSGPMIIEEPDTTVVVPPGWSIRRDEFSNLVLSNLAACSEDDRVISR